MKLLYKTAIHFLLISLVVLCLGGLGLYYWMQHQVVQEIEEQLDLEIAHIAEEIEAGRPVNFPFITIDPLDKLYQNPRLAFGDSLIYDEVQGESEEYYYLKKQVQIHGKPYAIQVMTSYIGWKEYAEMILGAFVLVMLIIALGSVLMNYLSSKRIWKPFFVNLDQLEHFSVKSMEPILWQSSNIVEFQRLTSYLDKMTKQSRKEYKALREFTENASHEIQTPLSIIRMLLDRLSQNSMNEEAAKQLQDIGEAVNRLSRLNKRLLLLAKLDNDLYKERSLLDIGELIEDKVELMHDLFAEKKIRLSFVASEKVSLYANRDLLETLLLNLMSNMLRYAEEGGLAHIQLSRNELVFSNSGKALSFEGEEIFERFKKGEGHSKSNGLGLAIVKEIGILHQWDVHYRYQQGQHVFRIGFALDK